MIDLVLAFADYDRLSIVRDRNRPISGALNDSEHS